MLWRHGRTAWNAEDRFQGHSDVHLDDVGRDQAARAAAVLAALRPASITSSDLARARETADALAAVTGVPVTLDPRLRETFGGSWQGRTLPEIRAVDAAAYDQWRMASYVDVPAGGGETRAQLAARVVPAITDAVATDGRPVLMGQSLGALAALHMAWTSPATFGGLFLQSGSFFTPALDPQESGFEYWREVTGFVASVHAASQAAPGAPPTTLTCGSAEENLANNVAMRDHLADVGVETGWGEVRDGHTWTCWRDTLDPHLTDLLTRVWA